MHTRLRSYLKQQSSRAFWLHNAVRFFLAALVVFNFLNLIGVLHFTLQFTWRGLFITALVTWAILEGVAYRYFLKKGFGLHAIIWIIVFLSLVMDASADIFHLYSRFEWWDQCTHFVNSGLICLAIFISISAFWLNRPGLALLHKPARLHLGLFISATTTMALSALYEIEEYIEDVLYGTHRSGPGTDTPNDLLCNALGIILSVAIIWIIMKLRHKKPKLLS